MLLSFPVIYPVCLLSVAVVTAIILGWATSRAVRHGFVDHPDDRKNHERPVPPIGGLVMIPVFMVLAPLFGLSFDEYWELYLALFLLVAIGALDDKFDLSPQLKLLCQLGVAAIVVVPGDAVLRDLGHLFGAEKSLIMGVLGIPFTIVCLVFLINAMNMIDGIDGLAGGLSFVMLGWLAVAAAQGGDANMVIWACLLMAVLAGFLVRNMRYPGHRRATVFLGDAGSMALGLLVAWLAINISQAPTPGLVPMGVGWIILVPIVDTFALFITRMKSGRRAFQPGHDHLHHRLLAMGLTPGQVTMVLWVVAYVGGAIGVWGPAVGFDEGPLTFGWVTILLGYTIYLVRRGKTLYPADHREGTA